MMKIKKQQLVVPCTNKIRKVILKNLQKSARDSFNKSRSKKSKEVLKSILNCGINAF